MDNTFMDVDDTKKPKEAKEADSNNTEEETTEEQNVRSPLLDVAEWRFHASRPDDVVSPADKKIAIEKLNEYIKTNSASTFYVLISEALGWKQDAALLEEFKKKNEEDLKKIEVATEEAKENLGDTEVTKCLSDKADYLAKIGEKEKAVEAYEEALKKTVGSASRIDVVLKIIRVALCHDDVELTKKYIDKAKLMVDKGGDWERRNLLKIYEATYFIIVREFKDAATLFLDSIATFTCTDMMNYNTFIFYTVVSSLVSLGRPVLRSKLVTASEILSVQHEIPHIEDLIQSLHKCRYDKFFKALVNLSFQIKADRYFSTHHDYFMREMRIVGYSQFLRSYRSVTLSSMAKAFGISSAFLDKELSRFISSGRLNCKIDKVNDVVETNRPDSRNSKYHAVIKQGDILLSRVQKLSKIITY